MSRDGARALFSVFREPAISTTVEGWKRRTAAELATGAQLRRLESLNTLRVTIYRRASLSDPPRPPKVNGNFLFAATCPLSLYSDTLILVIQRLHHLVKAVSLGVSRSPIIGQCP